MEGGDEGDFSFAVGEDCPEEGCDVGECGCGDECAGEVVEGCFGDDAFVELTDDESDDPAFGGGDCPWEEEGCAEFVGVVCSGEPGHGVGMEGEEGEVDEFDGGCDRATELRGSEWFVWGNGWRGRRWGHRGLLAREGVKTGGLIE